jgi:hypothetical protein
MTAATAVPSRVSSPSVGIFAEWSGIQWNIAHVHLSSPRQHSVLWQPDSPSVMQPAAQRSHVDCGTHANGLHMRMLQKDWCSHPMIPGDAGAVNQQREIRLTCATRLCVPPTNSTATGGRIKWVYEKLSGAMPLSDSAPAATAAIDCQRLVDAIVCALHPAGAPHAGLSKQVPQAAYHPCC